MVIYWHYQEHKRCHLDVGYGGPTLFNVRLPFECVVGGATWHSVLRVLRYEVKTPLIAELIDWQRS